MSAALDVKVSGAFAYVATGNSGVQIVDIADPIHPRLVGANDTPGSAVGMGVANGYMFVSDYTGLQIVPAQCAEALGSDCNGNGVSDEDEIALHPSADWNGDGILDV